MKTLTILIALSATFAASAQEKVIWACQGIDSSGYGWVSGKWESKKYNTDNWLLTLNGTESALKQGDIEYRLVCVNDRFQTCVSLEFGMYVTFNQTVGSGVIADTFGAMSTDTEQRDSIYLELIQCTKF